MNEEIIQIVRQEIIKNFNMLSDEEKEIIRTNKGTAYTSVLKKLFPQGVFEGLSSGEAQNISTPKRGLGTR